MTQPHRSLLSVEAAKQQILAAMPALTESHCVDLRSALQRILAEPIIAPINSPPYHQSAMDGYALNSADLPATAPDNTCFPVVGTAWAGTPFTGPLQPGDCVRIMTGAPLPAPLDTIIMQEQTERSADQIRLKTRPKAGDNVRYCGEDIAQGSTVLAAGQALWPPQIGLLASLGIAEVKVLRKLKVAFFSTGDELRPLGASLAAGQIYDSNRYTLQALLSRLNVEVFDLGVIADQLDAIREALHTAATLADVVITSGGVSVGEADFVKNALAELGQVDFWKIAMKPGKPLAFGQIGNARFFGLPGNPVSVMATFYQLVQPALLQQMGLIHCDPPLRLQVLCTTPLEKSPGRTDYQRGILQTDATGKLSVKTTGLQSSGALSSMSQANCFIVLPAEWGPVAAGTLVEVEPFVGII